MARFLPNGEVEFLGRVDEQIKIRGFRVEPGEIVSALNSFPGIQASAVSLLGGANGDRRLAAYVVCAPGAQITLTSLRETLLTESNTWPESEFVEPQTHVEQRLAAILAPLLHVERVSAKDNFFLLGGHSLLGTQLITKIKEAFDVELSLLSLFDHPTLEEMSVEVENLILVKIGAGNGDGSKVSRAIVQESQ